MPTTNHQSKSVVRNFPPTWTLHPPPNRSQNNQIPKQKENTRTPLNHLQYSHSSMAAARPVFCQLRTEKPLVLEIQKLKMVEPPPDTNGKIVLQPRVCTLRSFGDDRGAVIKANRENEVSRFFDILSDYIESSKRSHDFEIISGRLAMVVFAATVGMEVATGNSVFRKMDLQGIEEAGGVCLAAISSAAIFAWCSSNRNRVGRIFTVSCNTFIDSLIDQIVDGLFYDADINDWSDEI